MHKFIFLDVDGQHGQRLRLRGPVINFKTRPCLLGSLPSRHNRDVFTLYLRYHVYVDLCLKVGIYLNRGELSSLVQRKRDGEPCRSNVGPVSQMVAQR